MRIINLFSVINLIFITFVILISGCSRNLNYSQYLDLPKDIYKSFNPVATAPKETGIINFETYAIVRAKKGERLYDVADRINISSKKLAIHNGLSENYQLGQGEILAIPIEALPEHNDKSINIAKVASKAINRVKTEQKSEVKKEIEKTDQTNTTKIQSSNDSDSETIKTTVISEAYIKPIEGEISSPFSYNVNGNQGINIQASSGEPIKATNDGTIVLVSRGVNQPTVVLIRHDSEILSAYSNISDVNLSKGDRVKKGQIIGVISTGADHLHFEIIKGTERIDPITFLEAG
jgi:murein DD-endopeptidase MepM/ murein hydrolase activator NlpD